VYRGLLGSLLLAKPVAEKLGVAPNAPVEQRLRALDGLSIAAPSATSAYLTPYKSAAETVGARIKFVYMTQPAMVAALQVGAVQGMAGAAPFSLTPIVNGSGVLWISGPKGDLPPASRPSSSACLQTTADYARGHPEVVQALQAVFVDVGTLIKGQPDQAKALLAKAFPQLEPPVLEAAFAESADNWSQSAMTLDDIRQEIRIQESAGSLPGVGAIDAAAVLLGAA
jgi:ABC-type nitrate/sulfonate/bicarbonate transport system substrate-binding protein